MATDFKMLNILRKIPMFGELSVDEAKLVLSACQQKEYEPNEVIFKYGGGSREMLILMSGELDVRSLGGVSVAQIKPGQLVGEMGVLTGKIRSATVVALGKSMALSLNTAEFDRLLRKFQKIGLKIFKNIVDDLSDKIKTGNVNLEGSTKKMEQLSNIVDSSTMGCSSALLLEHAGIWEESQDLDAVLKEVCGESAEADIQTTRRSQRRSHEE